MRSFSACEAEKHGGVSNTMLSPADLIGDGPSQVLAMMVRLTTALLKLQIARPLTALLQCRVLATTVIAALLKMAPPLFASFSKNGCRLTCRGLNARKSILEPLSPTYSKPSANTSGATTSTTVQLNDWVALSPNGSVAVTSTAYTPALL